VIDPHHKWLLRQITERFLAAEAVKAVDGRWHTRPDVKGDMTFVEDDTPDDENGYHVSH
jgi:hypothetical protein